MRVGGLGVNVTEANAWFTFLRGLETGAPADHQSAGAEAAMALTERANKALGAGPRPAQVGEFAADLQDAIDTADGDAWAVIGDRPVETTDAAGGVL